MVIRDDYAPWTASTLREILLPADEVAAWLASVGFGRHGDFGSPRAIGSASLPYGLRPEPFETLPVVGH